MSDKNKLLVMWIMLFTAFSAWIIPVQYYALNPQLAENYRLSVVLISLLIALLAFWVTENRLRFIHLLKEAKVELLKVVWPTKQEVTTHYITVLVFSIVAALYCYFIDIIVEWVLYKGILG